MSRRHSRTTWTVYKLAAKQVGLGEIEAADEREAVENAAGKWLRISLECLRDS